MLNLGGVMVCVLPPWCGFWARDLLLNDLRFWDTFQILAGLGAVISLCIDIYIYVYIYILICIEHIGICIYIHKYRYSCFFFKCIYILYHSCKGKKKTSSNVK